VHRINNGHGEDVLGATIESVNWSLGVLDQLRFELVEFLKIDSIVDTILILGLVIVVQFPRQLHLSWLTILQTNTLNLRFRQLLTQSLQHERRIPGVGAMAGHS